MGVKSYSRKGRQANPVFHSWAHGLGALRRKRYAASLRSLRRTVHLTDPLAARKRRTRSLEIWNEERSIHELAYFYGHTKQSLRKMIGNYIRSHGPIRVLDIGCGSGLFLKWLKENFNASVRTTGIGIKNKKGLEGVDTFRTIPIEKFIKRDFFDFIFSVEGAAYAANRALTLENVYHSLRVGGTAYIHLGNMVSIDLKQLIGSMRKQTGANVKIIGPGVFVIERKTRALVDLHAFYPQKSDANNLLSKPVSYFNEKPGKK